MRIKHSIALLAVLAIGFTTYSFAQDRDRGGRHEGGRRENESQGPRDLHNRLRHAHEGIERGIKSGALTRQESHRLKRELDAVRDDEARMRSDGRLTHRETERLERELNRLEKHISELKHNERTR